MSIMEESELYNDSSIVGNTTCPSVESQSTQLLDFVLGRAEPPSFAKHVVNPNPAPADEKNAPVLDPRSSGNSGDASLSSVSASGPYHFHGLAATQTQAHFAAASVEPDSQSQKENAPEKKHQKCTKRPVELKSAATTDPSCVPSASPRILAPAQATRASTTLPPIGPLSPSAPPHSTKAVTFLSPAPEKRKAKNEFKEPAPDRPPMRFRTQPSPLTSQDSFADPTDSQVEGHFLATSSIFVRPLDELGQPESQEDESPAQASAENRPPAEAAEPQGDMIRHSGSGETRKYSLSTASSHGRVLVVDSDSSSSSQDVSNPSQEATQLVSASTTNYTDPNAFSILGASAAGSNSNSAQEATQPVSELNGASVLAGTSFAQSSVGGSSAGGPRSLLNSIPPEKRQRYLRHFKQDNPGANVGSEVSRNATIATSATSNAQPAPPEAAEPNSSPEEEFVQDSEAQIDSDLLAKEAEKPAEEEEEEGEEEVILPSDSDVPEASRQSRVAEKGSDDEAPAKPASRQSAKGRQQPSTPIRPTSPKKAATMDSDKPLAASRKMGASTAVKVSRSAASRASPTPNKIRAPVAGPATASKTTKPVQKAQKPPTPACKPIPEPAVESQSEPRGRGRPRKADKGKGRQRVPASAPSSKASAPGSKKASVRGQSPAGSESAVSTRPLGKNEQNEEEENEVATELADDEHMEMGDEDQEEVPESAAASARSLRKRKRAVGPPSKNTRAKQGKQGVRATASVQRPPAKKRRTSDSTTGTVSVIACFGSGKGTQVFALFKGDSCFYGAEVHSLSNARAHVKYFDRTEDTNLGIAQLRRFELREGDTVIPEGKYKATVIDDTSWANENEVRVRYIEGPDEGDEIDIAADEIRIPVRAIQSQWKDRTLEPADISPAVGKKLRDTASPSKMSVMSVKSGKDGHNRILSKYGFVLTLKPEGKNWAQEKARLEAAIREGGGTVFADWMDLFTLQGSYTSNHKRWTLSREDIKFALKDESIDKIFLLSDLHSQKPRYLLALALGIPCVSAEWVHALLAGEDIEWSSYLLPAGYSEYLSTRMSQLVGIDWGTTSDWLTEIAENKVALRVLEGRSVLCVGTDLFPQPPKKTLSESDKSKEASRTVPRIIAAMGAHVEAVTDVRHATHARNLAQYDYVVVKDHTLLPDSVGEDVCAVDVAWVKECLIASRLLRAHEDGKF